MKISVKYEKTYGVERFYPNNDWTLRFMDVFRRVPKAKSFSRRQVNELKELGFEIEAISSKVEI